MDDLTTRKVLSVVSHASIFINATVLAIAIPIMILMLSNDPIVQGNSKEALNFHINLLIGYAIVALLFISIIGIPVAFVLGGTLALVNLIMPIVAIVHAATNTERPYRYPFVWHML